MNGEDYIGKETTINFSGYLRMSQPCRSNDYDEIFTIVRVAKSGLYIIRDSNGKEYPIAKRNINFFNTNKHE